MADAKSSLKDEIDIIELLGIIWKRKYWIALVVFLICLVTVILVVKMDNIYQSTAIIRPVESDSSKYSSLFDSMGSKASFLGINLNTETKVTPFTMLKILVNDDNFLYHIVDKYKFENYVIKDYDKKIKDPVFNKNKVFLIAYEMRQSTLINNDSSSGAITVSFQNKDRFFASRMVNILLRELSDRYKKIEMVNLQKKINGYENEINVTPDITLKNKLAELVAQLIQTKILSQSGDYYMFEMLVKPTVPDALDKVGPKRAIICVAVFIASLFISIISVLIIELLSHRDSHKKRIKLYLNHNKF